MREFIEILLNQRAAGFPGFTGTHVAAFIPISASLLNELIAQALPPSAPVSELQIDPQPGNVPGVSRDTQDATLEVSDDGIGIAPDALPHIFERFYRSDPSRSNRADGAGLGLSLVKWAVDQHHGSVHVESTPGTGSRFLVRFPA